MAIRKELMSKPLLQKYEIIDCINLIRGDHAIRDRALVALLFMSGCRVSELVKYIIEIDLKHEVKNKQTGEIELKPITERKLVGNSIQKKQIEIDENRDIMKLINIRTLKRREIIYKIIPIIISKDRKLYDLFLPYYLKCSDDEHMFPITRQRTYKILTQIGLYTHYLRHCRATNLVIDYNLNAQELKQFFNWKDTKPADAYVHLNVEDLVNKMKR